MFWMKLWEKVLFWIAGQKKTIWQKSQKAWTGVSILIFNDDSAATPKKHRINHYVLIFFVLLITAPPIAALGLYIRRRIQKVGPTEVMQNRMLLLNTLNNISEEKSALLAKADSQIYQFYNISNNQHKSILQKFYQDNLDNIVMEKRADKNKIHQILNEIQNIHARALLLRARARNSLKLIWNRMMIHHFMPRRAPLNPGPSHITSLYGKRSNPVAIDITSDGEFHSGVDIASRHGTPIIATGPGKIIQAVQKETVGYGRFIQLHHGLGYTTLYGHCSEILVEKGQIVKRGEIIARVGSSGRATGSHVHYEVRLGAGMSLDPMPFIRLK